ncbi:hypothetical protein [Nocardia abscessus]|uniref:hypothetical protein n=1 Tax=Nocardia abscessus TaxID=120957 RepID=UPI0024570FA6|nr:hypothetical protein [Nocardia abscessus]
MFAPILRRLCWYRYRVCWPDGVVLDEGQGLIRAFLMPHQFWALAAAIGEITADPRIHRHASPPDGTPQTRLAEPMRWT